MLLTIYEKCIYCGNDVQARITDENETDREVTAYFSFLCGKCGARSFYLKGVKNTPLRFTFEKYYTNKRFEYARRRTIAKLMAQPLV